MKKLLLTAIAASFCIGAYAQTEKGKIIAGGTISAHSNKVNSQATTQKATSLNIGPSIGFFVAKNMAAGLGLEYVINKNNPYIYSTYLNGLPYTVTVSGNKSEAMGIAPFFRYYWDLHERVKLFGQANTTFYWGKSNTLIPDGTEIKSVDNTAFIGSIQPGIAIFPTKRIAIELKVPLFTYNYQKSNYVDPNMPSATSNSFSFGSDLTKPVLGINFHF